MTLEIEPDAFEYIREHDCGLPVRIRFEIVPSMTSMAEVHIESKVTYLGMDDSEHLNHCPRCGVAFPGHETKA